MSESLMGFTQGFLAFLVIITLWNGYRRGREWRRTIEERVDVCFKAISAPEGSVDLRFNAMQLAVETHLNRLRVEMNSLPQREHGASDAAIANLAARISTLEKQLTAQDLTILDTAERVAHKLKDRQRKRDELAEVGDVDEIPSDPNLLLARARAAFPDPAMRREQLQLIDDDTRTA